MTRREMIELLARKNTDRLLGTPPKNGRWPESYFDCHDLDWRRIMIEKVEHFFDDLDAAGFRIVPPPKLPPIN